MVKIAKDIAARLGNDPKNYEAKSFRRYGAAQLAESGISCAGLKMAGNLKDAKNMEHMEHAKKACNDLRKMLDGEEARA